MPHHYRRQQSSTALTHTHTHSTLPFLPANWLRKTTINVANLVCGACKSVRYYDSCGYCAVATPPPVKCGDNLDVRSLRAATPIADFAVLDTSTTDPTAYHMHTHTHYVRCFFFCVCCQAVATTDAHRAGGGWSRVISHPPPAAPPI